MIKNEENLILKFQKLDLTFFMRIISLPFNYEVYSIVILILLLNRKIEKKILIYLILGKFIIFNIKMIFGKDRPFENNINIYNLSNKDLENRSFPSGHAFISYVLCKLILRNIRFENDLIYLIIKILPYLVSISRVYLGVHYPIDVIFGLIFGIIYDYFYKYIVN